MKTFRIPILSVSLMAVIALPLGPAGAATFSIGEREFLLNDGAFIIHSGELHYATRIPNSIPLPGYAPVSACVDSNSGFDAGDCPTTLPEQFKLVRAAAIAAAPGLCSSCCCSKIRIEVQCHASVGECWRWPTLKEGTYDCKKGNFKEDAIM